MSDIYVVTTHYRKPDHFNGRPIMHAYGPYSKSKALKVRKELLDEHDDLVDPDGVLHCSVNKLWKEA